MNSIEINAFDKEYPKRLLKIKDYPSKLYCVGNIKLLNYEKIIAMVGARNSSDYGSKYTNIFAQKLSQAGICIISGMAIGTDTSAHIGALNANGKTIAVLPGGINKVYPKENLELFYKIIKNGGCIVSEQSDNEGLLKSSFVRRNRIISGMSDAVFVSECTLKSGTMYTVKYARKQEKPIFCLPHNIDSEIGIGINTLIEEGAIPVLNTEYMLNKAYGLNIK